MEPFSKDKAKKAVEILGSTVDSKLVTHLNSCVHCGLCNISCMYYLSMKEPKYVPARKVELVSSLYRRYHTTVGKVVPKLVNARELDETMSEEMIDLLFGACTMCGRCVKHCSIGVDIAYVVRTGRSILSAMGMVPDSLNATVKAAMDTGNNMGIPADEFVDTLKWMEDELKDELNDLAAEIPLDQKGKDVLYTLNPREPKFFPLSISAMAKIFYAAKESWTLSTRMYDITNYAFFSGNAEEAKTIAERLYDEIHELGCKSLTLGECGHGSRVMRWEAPNYLKKQFDFTMENVVELIGRYIREGRIKLDKTLNNQKVTLHDPCNLTRNGGMFNELRFVVKSAANDFIEMVPCGNENFCCGGGGGQLAMGEYNERRLKTGELKAEQIRKSGAKVVVTPCHNCVDQLTQINFTYKLGIQIKTVAEIVAGALVLEQ